MISLNANIARYMKSNTVDLPVAVEQDDHKGMRETKEYLGHLMLGAAFRLREATTQALAGLELTPREFGLLNQVILEPLLTQAQLGERLGIDRTTMVLMVDRLVVTGWLERKADPDDRRVYRIAATPDGATQHLQAVAVVVAAENSFLSPLDSAQSKTLRTSLGQLLGG